MARKMVTARVVMLSQVVAWKGPRMDDRPDLAARPLFTEDCAKTAGPLENQAVLPWPPAPDLVHNHGGRGGTVHCFHTGSGWKDAGESLSRHRLKQRTEAAGEGAGAWLLLQASVEALSPLRDTLASTGESSASSQSAHWCPVMKQWKTSVPLVSQLWWMSATFTTFLLSCVFKVFEGFNRHLNEWQL